MNAAGRILRIFSLALLALVLPASSPAATINREPAPHADAPDVPSSPLDLRSVAFGQRGTELVLRFTAAQDWEVGHLSSIDGRVLCLHIYYGKLPTPRARVCVYDKGENTPGLAYSRLDPFGQSVENRLVAATITRPDRRSLVAEFEPSGANLGQGRFSWQAVSTWSCGEPRACEDRLPDNGNVIARLRPLAEPRCFGAASRNPRFRCINTALKLAVVPTPTDAVLTPNARCAIISVTAPYTCQFGVRAAVANRTVALVGDSHAAHWRGAIEVVAQARRWRGFSLTRSGCPLSMAPPDLPKARRASCARWRRALGRWFHRHPQVRTVFVSQLSGVGVHAPGSRNRREVQIQGYLRAWRNLPKSVRQIIVLRDVPFSSLDAPSCVERAMARRRRPGLTCAIPRSRALRRDPAAIAARRRGMGRVHVVDLTRFMCSPQRCFPVVGGVLVHKDKTHITPLFAGTLGPFVLQRVARLL